ncbi:nuatigenin 3-beta-glucosyltransferase-like [Rutidosis leptorrhynchoides]|uniref:nuatigenin 3-beta-glucosyltransferase-like n=1 Tax=Rutidosis leptorrhynchoides TaxID=125765 RepID=UPI003A98DFAC
MSPEKNYPSELATNDGNFHVVFLPLLCASHMMPLVCVARLFAARGVRSTIVTSSHTLPMFQDNINFDIARGYPISFHTVNIPPWNGLAQINVVRKPMEQAVRDLVPNCIFSDMFLTWTVDLADELKIPTLMFYPDSMFFHSVLYSLKVHYSSTIAKSEDGTFVVPNLPDKVTMKRPEVPDGVKLNTMFGDLIDAMFRSEKRSYGLVHNSFYEIEPAYADHMKKSVNGPKIWHIGPLFQFFNNNNSDCLTKTFVLEKPYMFTRLPGLSNMHESLYWLDTQKPKSVIYACFGSMTTFPAAQITEIALALEECDQPFVWVVKKKDDNREEIDGLPEGFEERIMKANKGFIITEWAPQVEILQHFAVGRFFTHCGWGSVLEAVVAGVPLVTWPLTADHFENEKLVELLGIGVKVGAEVWNPDFDITSPVIGKQMIVEAIAKLQDGSDMVEIIKRNLKELSMKAKRSVHKGGSSANSLASLIEDIKAFRFTPKA